MNVQPLIWDNYMKKLLIVLLVLVSIVILNAEELEWTVTECKYPGRIYQEEVNHFYADRRLKVRLGMLWPGTKVTPLQFCEGSFQVRFGNGQIGWVSFLNLKEAQDMKISENCDLYAVDLLANTTQWDKVIGKLEKGDIVKLTAVGDEGEFRVQAKGGKRGSVSQNKAYPQVEDQLYEYDREAEHSFFFKDKLDELVLDQHDSVLFKIAGQPSAIMKNIGQTTYYYPQIEVYHEGLRYKWVNFTAKNSIVVSSELIGEGSTSFIDKLPLYLSIKKNNKLNFLDKLPDIKLFENVRQHHWIVRVLIRIFQFILILVFFSIARIIAFQLMRLLALIRPLSNGLVLTFSYLINLVLNYIYFIYLISHVITEDYIFTAVVMLFMLVVGHRRIRNRILYYRCPNCHLMWTALDQGSDVVGKKHITENKSETRLTGDYTSSSGQRVKEYTRYHWKERKTEKQIRDHRQCNNCGYNWDVERTETVDGHV